MQTGWADRRTVCMQIDSSATAHCKRRPFAVDGVDILDYEPVYPSSSTSSIKAGGAAGAGREGADDPGAPHHTQRTSALASPRRGGASPGKPATASPRGSSSNTRGLGAPGQAPGQQRGPASARVGGAVPALAPASPRPGLAQAEPASSATPAAPPCGRQGRPSGTGEDAAPPPAQAAGSLPGTPRTSVRAWGAQPAGIAPAVGLDASSGNGGSQGGPQEDVGDRGAGQAAPAGSTTERGTPHPPPPRLSLTPTSPAGRSRAGGWVGWQAERTGA